MPKILKSVDLAGVNLDIYGGSIGVSCSGGADSSILLYNLMKHKTDDVIHIFTTGNNQRLRRNVEVATKVVEKCIQLTGNSNVEHHISYCEIQSFETLFPKLKTWFDNGTIDILYTGLTENPPTEVSDTFIYPIDQTIRNPGKIKPTLQYDGAVYIPWVNIHKKVIADIYTYSNVMDELYPITRSCEYDPSIDNGDLEDPLLGHCGKCWWCEERNWAFGRLD